MRDSLLHLSHPVSLLSSHCLPLLNSMSLSFLSGALALLGYTEDAVKISIIVCQKRHNTRLVYEVRVTIQCNMLIALFYPIVSHCIVSDLAGPRLAMSCLSSLCLE